MTKREKLNFEIPSASNKTQDFYTTEFVICHGLSNSKPVLIIRPTTNSLDVEIPEGVTLSEAAQRFIFEVKRQLGVFND